MRFTTPLMALVAALLLAACGPSTEIIDTINGAADDTEQVTLSDDDDSADTGDEGFTLQDDPGLGIDTGDDVVYEDLDQDGWTGQYDCNDSPLDEDGDGRVDGYFINPDAPEICDNVDNNCDGQIDDGLDTFQMWPDVDGDGYGDFNAESVQACDTFPGFAPNAQDCNDLNEDVNPDATEVIGDGIDSDCDELTAPQDDSTGESTVDEPEEEEPVDTGSGDDDDSAGTEDVPVDADADGFVDSEDCDDSDPAVNPDADEICGDAIDNDCSGDADGTDAIDTTEWFVDDDSDGFGDTSAGFSCDGESNTVSEAGDCDDADGSINPDAIELDVGIDGIDNNCDGSVDESWQVNVIVSYGSTVTGDLNTGVYSDGAFTNANGWQVRDEAFTGTEAEVSWLSDAWDVSAQCGLVINGVGSSQDNLCWGGAMDASVTIDIWWLGVEYTESDLQVWIADASNGSCALVLQVDNSSSCDPVNDTN